VKALLAALICAALPSQVRLLGPIGAPLFVGDAVTVSWRVLVQQPTENWDLYFFSTQSGAWVPIALDLPPGDVTAGAIHSFSWTIPLSAVSTSALVSVTQDNTGTDFTDISFAPNTIATPLAVNTPFGQACGTSTLIPATGPTPVIGFQTNGRVTSVQQTATGVWATASLTELVPPLDMAFIGLPGCLLYVHPDLVISEMLTINVAGGFALWGITFPNDPVLIGVKLIQQALVFDTASPNGGHTTNAMRATISDH